MAGLSLDVIRKWEQLKGAPELDSLRKLAKLYRRPLDHFEAEEPPPGPPFEPPPLYGLKTSPNAPPDALERAQEFLDRLNREYLDQVEAIKKKRRPKR